MRPTRVGLFGIGLETYWQQFAGLKDRLEGHLRHVADRLERPGIEIVNLGLVDSSEGAVEAGHRFRQSDVDIIFLYATTYALSSTVLPVVRRAKVPVIILNLSPESTIDYARFNALGDRSTMTGEWLGHCSACPVPEIANVFVRAGIPFYQVTGRLQGDPAGWQEIDEWIAASRVASVMSQNRLGLLGHYYSGMLDIYTDVTLQSIVFGTHIEFLEIEDLTTLRRVVSAAEIQERVTLFEREFDVQSDCRLPDLEAAARTSVALDRLVDRYALGSLAYYYKGTGNPESESAVESIILGNSLLTARGVPVAGEYEVKNVQAMKIMDSFGAGGSFTEFYAVDWDADVVLMGHDGPGHIAIAEGRTKVRPLSVFHGKVGKGLSVEMSVKSGSVTLLSIVETPKGGLNFLVAEGESVDGPILEIGNTNSRYRFPRGARHFIESWNVQGPAHHCAVGIGRVASKIEKLGKLIGVDTIRVC
jgi:L-arabinose isomerase